MSGKQLGFEDTVLTLESYDIPVLGRAVKTRDEAVRGLIAMGPKIRHLVARAAKKDPDAEIRYRAREVLERLGTAQVAPVETVGSFRPRLMTGP